MDSNRESINFNPDEILDESIHSRNSTAKMKDKPIRLIEFQEKGLVLNPEAMALLRSIEEQIIIVSVVGKEKTGKSYLLNLLLNADDGVILFNNYSFR